jgi:hypothetical protein
MKILQTSICVINRESKEVINRNPPETFEQYVSELINYIRNNDAVRKYRSSNTTEVIRSVLALCEHSNKPSVCVKQMNIISERLLRKEIETQEQISHMGVEVQKGCLIQSLVFDDENECFCYLLAKAEYTEWVDDDDFLFKTGFSRNKKSIWKTCMIDIPNTTDSEFYAQIYSYQPRKYWWHDFLELIEVNSNDDNTLRAWSAIENTISKTFPDKSCPDRNNIRNYFIGHLRSNEGVDYNNMVNGLLDSYEPEDPTITNASIQKLKLSLLSQPKKQKFDVQFSPVPDLIKSRVIKKNYKVNTGIELKVHGDEESIQEKMQLVVDDKGVPFLKIITNNRAGLKEFQKQE